MMTVKEMMDAFVNFNSEGFFPSLTCFIKLDRKISFISSDSAAAAAPTRAPAILLLAPPADESRAETFVFFVISFSLNRERTPSPPSFTDFDEEEGGRIDCMPLLKLS